MPARVPNASGNWSDASNWLTASNTLSLHASSVISVSSLTRYTATFTAPSTSVSCIGVAVYITSRTAATNITVALQGNSTDVVSRTYTASDVPLNCEGWYFFRFTSPYQYQNTTAGFYRFRIITDSSANTTGLRADAAGTAYAFIAVDDRTSTVASTDDVYVLADVAGSAKTITFDQNDAAVSCLSINVGYNATLTFSRNMTTQMILGNGTTAALANIYSGGVFAIGTESAPIPAAFTATLQLDASANNATNFVISNGSSGSAAGLFSAVGDPTYNARSRTIEGYATGWYATTTSANAAVGDTTLVLTDDLGLRATGGDILTIGECNGSSTFSGQYQEFVTTAYNAATRTVTLNSALTNLRNAGAVVNVMNRNVVLKPVSTARLSRINAASGNNTVVRIGLVLRHVQIQSFSLIGNQGQGTPYTALGNADVVGCSLYNPASLSLNNFYQIFAARFINCHAFRTSLINTSQGIAYPEVSSYSLQVLSSSVVGSPFVFATHGALIRDCLGAGTYFVQSGNYCRVENCAGGDMESVGLNTWDSEFYTIAVKSLSYVIQWAGNCIIDKLSVAGSFAGLVSLQNQAYTGSHLIRNCTFATAPTLSPRLLSSGNANVNGPGGRIAFVQNSSISGFGDTLTAFMAGNVKRYVASAAPQSVTPVPSGASVVNRMESLYPFVNASPLTQTYRIPVGSGAQNNTVTIPVYLSGWSTSLPSNTDLYVELFAPGATVPITSTTTVTANDQWQYLTVSGISTGQGHLVVRVILKKYVANAVMYVDWPLNMSTVNMDWYDGRPNEYLIPLASYTAGQDFKSLRIDGPGMQEFKLPVTSRRTTVKIKGRYDSAHGSTNKPRLTILAQPNLGITQQTATMTAGADTWENLSLSFTPTQAGTITLRLESRAAQPWGRAWFDTFTAE